MPHCLLHARELIETGGHHGAYNTSTAEASHPGVIKAASKFSQTRASLNETHEGMVSFVCWQKLWEAAIKRNEVGDPVAPPRRREHEPLSHPLPYTRRWSEIQFHNGRPPRDWKTTFLSKQVLITHEELVTLFLNKVQMVPTPENFMKVIQFLTWECYGGWSPVTSDGRRSFVAYDSRSSRRDFVRLEGSQDNTAFTAALMMFVKVSGFGHGSGVFLPAHLCHPGDNDYSFTFAVVRWLGPHPNCLLRDSKLRPICPPPFDINHALWRFVKLRRDRPVFRNERCIARQLNMFPGPIRRESVNRLKRAWYDVVEVQTIDHVINCTRIDAGFLETIVLPF